MRWNATAGANSLWGKTFSAQENRIRIKQDWFSAMSKCVMAILGDYTIPDEQVKFKIDTNMRKISILTLSLLFFILLAVSAFARSEFTGKVVKVADGDTVTVLAPGNQQVKVRLYGIDCPERKQAFGQRARQFTAQMVAGETVRVQILDTDRYGRVVGVVLKDGENLNRALLANGYAWVYPQYCKASFCQEWKDEEFRARQGKRGLWVDKAPIEPWNFRRKK